MEAQARLDGGPPPRLPEAEARDRLDAPAEVLAVIRLHEQRARPGAAHGGQFGGIGARRVQQRRDPDRARPGRNLVELVPVARERIPVDRGREVEPVREHGNVAGAEGGVVGVHPVALAPGVAGVGRRGEVGVGEAEVGLVRDLVGAAGGQRQALDDGRAGRRRQADTAEQVELVEPGVEGVAAGGEERRALRVGDGLKPVHVVAPHLGDEPSAQTAEPVGRDR